MLIKGFHFNLRINRVLSQKYVKMFIKGRTFSKLNKDVLSPVKASGYVKMIENAIAKRPIDMSDSATE